MKKIILITLASIICLLLYSGEINIMGKFGDSANIGQLPTTKVRGLES